MRLRWGSAIILLLWCSSSLAQCPAGLRLPYNSSWLPYVEVTDEQVKGQDIDFIRQLLSAIPSELQLLQLPESRALYQLKSGEVDFLFAASYTKERADYAWFSVPYRSEVNVVLVHQAVLQQYPQLTDKTAFFALASRKLVGTFNPKGFYGQEFEQLKQLPMVQQRSVAIFDADQRLELVLSQRADYTLVDQAAWRHSAEKVTAYQHLVQLPFELYRTEVHLMFSKKTVTAPCVDLINRHIGALNSTRR